MSLFTLPRQLMRLPRRLSVQLSLLLSLLIASTLIAHAWLSADRQTQDLQDAIRKEAATLADSVAAGSAPLIVVDDLASLEDQLQRSATLPAVLGIRVSGPDQRILSEVARAPTAPCTRSTHTPRSRRPCRPALFWRPARTGISTPGRRS